MNYGLGGLWDTNASGVATPQAGRPVLTGGLQQMQMLQALRGGASLDQLQGMNPYTARPTQFLPQALPTYIPPAPALPVQQFGRFAPGMAPDSMSYNGNDAGDAPGDGGVAGGAVGGDGGGGGGAGSK